MPASVGLSLSAAYVERVHQRIRLNSQVDVREAQLRTLLTLIGQVGSGAPQCRRSGPRTGRTREVWAAKDGNVSFGLRGGPARIPNLKATLAYMDECGMAPQWLREYDWDAYDYGKLSDAEIARL